MVPIRVACLLRLRLIPGKRRVEDASSDGNDAMSPLEHPTCIVARLHDFPIWVEECLVATDGAGGVVGPQTERHRSVGAGAAVVTFGPDRTPLHATCMRMKVPGRQTVPRAETWAVLQVLKAMKDEKHMKIITDAMYVIKRL